MMTLQNMVLGFASDTPEELFQHWEHDENSLKFWRASSNFVCSFAREGETFFYRFASAKERTAEEIATELEFMQHLHNQGFPCVVPVPSKNGRLIESSGDYHAVVFTKANGSPFEADELSKAQVEHLGKSLASLHLASQTFNPAGAKRKSWRDVLAFIHDVLEAHPNETAAASELDRMQKWLGSLPVTEDQYGVIHYDFEPDNLFWNEEEHCFHAIDFDDSMYHWFAMDLVSMMGELQNTDAFVKGYRSVKALDDFYLDQLPSFQRFADLYKFTRLLRTLHDPVDSEAEWLLNLKAKLELKRDQLRAGFENEK